VYTRLSIYCCKVLLSCTACGIAVTIPMGDTTEA
jgi:hypothetical protein